MPGNQTVNAANHRPDPAVYDATTPWPCVEGLSYDKCRYFHGDESGCSGATLPWDEWLAAINAHWTFQ